MAVAKEQAFNQSARMTEPGDRQPHASVAERSQSLIQTIQAEVIPRLVLARRASRETARPIADATMPTEADILRFVGILLTKDTDEARGFVAGLHERGAPVETLYLDLLAPTARCLGDMWCEDTCHFADVTMGLSKLHRLLYELGPTFRREADAEVQGRRILLAPVPGEQHSFGLTMVAEFFRRASWDVSDQPAVPANADLIQLVRAERFDLVGLSIASEVHLDGLAHGIRALRRASRQSSLGILVGGPLFVQHPDLVARVGADATAIDAGQAPVQAEGLLHLLAGRS